MLERIRSRSLQGQKYHFKSNEPILLDEPQTVWLVKSGSLALFAITVKDGIPEGTRRYLFSVRPGEAMFSTAPGFKNQQRQILAVSLEDTELLRVSREDFSTLIAEANSEAAFLVEG